MGDTLATVAIGGLVTALGIMNMKGNISTLHSYHRKRVSEEDRIPFGREVGAGTILAGCSVMLKAGLQFAAERAEVPVLDKVGTGILVVGLAGGIAVITHAMMKYNKGIF